MFQSGFFVGVMLSGLAGMLAVIVVSFKLRNENQVVRVFVSAVAGLGVFFALYSLAASLFDVNAIG